MKIERWNPFSRSNPRGRIYYLDGPVADGYNPSGNVDGQRSTLLCRDEDIARLEQVLAVKGVHHVNMGVLFAPNVVEVILGKNAEWDDVHPRLEAVFAAMEPASQAPQWR